MGVVWVSSKTPDVLSCFAFFRVSRGTTVLTSSNFLSTPFGFLLFLLPHLLVYPTHRPEATHLVQLYPHVPSLYPRVPNTRGEPRSKILRTGSPRPKSPYHGSCLPFPLFFILSRVGLAPCHAMPTSNVFHVLEVVSRDRQLVGSCVRFWSEVASA